MAYIKKSVREKVWQKCNGRCAYCGVQIELKKMQVDHINPLFRNDTAKQLERMGIKRGKDEMSNYNPACRRCNLWKSTYTVEAFRKEIEKQLERLRRDNSNYRMALDYGLITENKHDVTFYFEKETATMLTQVLLDPVQE